VIRPELRVPLATAALFLGAAVLRLHDAWLAAPLSGFDGPFHAAYVGLLHWDGHWPLPDEGWSTHHPPAYYLLCALVWQALPDATSPGWVLFAMRLLNVASGLALGTAVWASARTLFPGRPSLPVYALALTLFLPMHVGPSVLLGNELPAAALSAAGLALLLRTLPQPGVRTACVAGLVLGLGLATKLSVGVTVVAAVAVLAARGVAQRQAGARTLLPALVLALAAFLVASPYFVRNVARYGAPVLTEVELSADAMRAQGYGQVRPWRDYLDPSPGAVLRPGRSGAARAVWPVTFSSVWFDVHGTLVDVHHPRAQQIARLLYALGALFTAAAALGAWLLARRRVESPVPLGVPALGLLSVLALAAYVAFSRAVATESVLKGTYLSSAVPAFAIFAAVGLDDLARRSRAARRAVAALLGVFVLSVGAILWHGWLAPPRINPADLYLRTYTDAPTERAFRYFVGREPRRPGGRAPAAFRAPPGYPPGP